MPHAPPRFTLTAASDLSEDDDALAFLGDKRVVESPEGAMALVDALGFALPGRLSAATGPTTAGAAPASTPARAVRSDGSLVDIVLDRLDAGRPWAPSRAFPGALFVYGTLMRGEERESAIRSVLPDTAPESGSVQGSLVHLGAWPGLVGGSGRVYGELYRSDDLGPLLRVLDPIEDFEGYLAPPRDYVRVVVRVETPRGPSWAWTYRFVGDTRSAPLIPTGRWRDAPRRLPGCPIP